MTMKYGYKLLTIIVALIILCTTLICRFEARLKTTAIPTTSPTAEACKYVVVRPALGENNYLITGCNYTDYRTGELLVAYFKEVSGLELVAAVMHVVEENPDNRVAVVLFRNSNIDLASLGTLAGLRVDREIDQVNLELLMPVDESFVGFVLEDQPRIRIRPDAELQVGHEIEAKQLSFGANPVSFNPPIKMTIDEIEPGGNTGRVQIPTTTGWPPPGTLLVVSHLGGTYQLSVDDYIRTTDICVRKRDGIEIHASGQITSGEFIGQVSPEGKETFELFGISTPIDPKYDIVPAFPHAVLMYRIEKSNLTLKPDEGWLNYHNTKRFEADQTGCLAFDINDTDNGDNTGKFDVEVVITP